MNKELAVLRKMTVEKFQTYLMERENTFAVRNHTPAWAAQQHVEMLAEHEWLNAKQKYEIALYEVLGTLESA